MRFRPKLAPSQVGRKVKICIIFKPRLHETGTKSNPSDFVLTIIVFVLDCPNRFEGIIRAGWKCKTVTVMKSICVIIYSFALISSQVAPAAGCLQTALSNYCSSLM